ncbi:MAG: hypothetical protein LCH39_01040 [Proteobacteria bacterium]|nr:hypothetical protein [Pseudomonadota bacterium]
MNKIMSAAIVVAAIFGISTASANDGVLFSNTSDPYFTTPAEFVAMGKMKSYQREQKKAIASDQMSPPVTQGLYDPAGGGNTGG